MIKPSTLRPALLSALASILLCSCSFHGAIHDDFYAGQNELRQKIPATVAIDTSAEIQQVRAYGNKYTIDVRKGLYDAVAKTLTATFDKVIFIDTTSASAPSDFIARPSFEVNLVNTDSWSGDVTFESTLSLVFEDPKSGRQVALYEKPSRILYQSPGSAKFWDYLNAFFLFTLSPIAMPASISANGRYGVELVEKHLTRDMTTIAGNIARDARKFSSGTWEDGVPPGGIRHSQATTSEQRPPTPLRIRSDVDKPLYTTPENPNNYAVVIAVEKYASLPAAEFAERDADAVRAHMVALGYPARNIYFLTAQQATRAKIAQSVNTWLPNRVGEDSTVFFFYSGHGAPNPQTNQAYLVPVDGDPEDLESTAYPLAELYAKLNSLKAREVIVALDSCFSGTGGRSVLAKGTRPLVGKVAMGAVPSKVITLTASDSTQVSGTLEEQGHGTFTYYLLKGLNGAAKNSSGRVTVQSLYDYLTPKVQDASRLHNRTQTPQLRLGNSEGAGARLR